MTASEAIEWLKGIEKNYIHGGDEFFDNARKIAISTAISALEKQIPKEVISQPYFYGQELHCPFCNFLIGWEYEIDKDYCRKCGQKLLWESDTE
ncbi:MAG: hypothetical protein IJZ54_06955 [Clostridia bacterium]|nr:hypothetical protein [Clostridia bacterium]